MNKQPERTAMTRQDFINAFLELSNYKSIDKITVAELAKKAGYNRSTFYQYFTDINHLLSSIEHDMLLYIKETILHQIGKEHPIELFITLFTQVNDEKRDILKLLLDNSIGHPFPAKLKETLIPAFAIQMHLPPEDEHAIILLDFYLSGIIAVLSRWITSETPMPPEKYALIIRGIVEGIQKSELLPLL